MRRFIVGILAMIGAITLLVVLAFAWSMRHMAAPSLPSILAEDSLVLSLTLGNDRLPEQSEAGGVMTLVQGRPLAVQTVVEALEHAAQDDKVKGVLLSIDGNALEIATVQEIRDALKAFKDKGKFIYTYTDSFGDSANGMGAYYLAAATTKIWMLPLGSLNFNGIMVEVPFAKKALDILMVKPQMDRRGEFKGAVESFTESDFTAPHKENTQRLIDGFTTQMTTDIARDRGIKLDAVRKVLDSSPLSAEDALSANMIDAVGYKDQVRDAIEKQTGKKPTYIPFDDYAHHVKSFSKGEKIAVVYAEGSISKEKTVRNPLTGEVVMDALEIAKSLKEAREDDSIKAVVLRVNSGGGSHIPCELIDREVNLTKDKKPVIVSMANYAASGGYWIACNAHKIVAQPGTITGSIGVFAGKFVTQGFWESIGVHWAEVHNGENANLWSTGSEFTEKGRKKFNEELDKIYTVFQAKVSKGRSLSLEQVSKIAKGQVWTGTEAKENGLVDALGGLTTAISLAKQEAGISLEAPVTLVHLPAPKSFWGMIFSRSSGEDVKILTRYPVIQKALLYLDGVLAKPEIQVKMG